MYTTSYEPLKALVYENYALTETLKALAEKGVVEATKIDIPSTLQKVERLTEQYLKASGLEFQKSRTKYQDDRRKIENCAGSSSKIAAG